MRITVGGVLLISGAAAFVVVGPLKLIEPSIFLDRVDNMKKTVEWAMGYFSSAPEAKPVEVTPVVPEPVAPAPVEAAPVVETPAPPPAVVTPAKKKRTRRARAKKTMAKPLVKSAAPAAQAASKAGGEDKLVGTYVALKLKTGRDVKGILQSKTASGYTVEIPGMGPFQYPASNVVSVLPAE